MSSQTPPPPVVPKSSISPPCAQCGHEHEPDEEHEYLYVDDKFESDLLDPISLVPIVDCVILPGTDCPHMFSIATLKRWLKVKQECPLCKCQIQEQFIRPAPLVVHTMLCRLLVYCPHCHTANETRAYSEIASIDAPPAENVDNSRILSPVKMQRGDLPQHLSKCPNAPVICPISFQGEVCSRHIRRKEMPRHQAECDLRDVTCPQDCGAPLCARDLPGHNCVKFLKSIIDRQYTEIAALQQALQMIGTACETQNALSKEDGKAHRLVRLSLPSPLVPREAILKISNQLPQHVAVAHFRFRGSDDFKAWHMPISVGLWQHNVLLQKGFNGKGAWSDIHSPWGTNFGGPQAEGAILLCCFVDSDSRRATVERDTAKQPSNITRLDITMPAPYNVYFLTRIQIQELHFP